MLVGVIGAMEVEIASLKESMKASETKTIAGMDFYLGNVGRTGVVLVRSGVGKVNAAICAHTLVLEFHVDCVLNTGVAGSLNNDLNIEDILVSKDAIYHDVNATVFGYAKGEVPQLGTRTFPADEKLAEKVVAAVAKVAPDVRAMIGRVASGDQFISDKADKERIRRDTDADCCEMEGAAIAQACFLDKVPFVIIRAISDKADGSDVMDYPAFEKIAAEHCAGIVKQMLADM